MTMQMYDVKEWHDCDKKMKIVGHSIVIAESAEEAKQKYLERYGSSTAPTSRYMRLGSFIN